MVICENENCKMNGEKMKLIDTDSRQEWCEETYICIECSSSKICRKEFDQNGKVILDKEIDNE